MINFEAARIHFLRDVLVTVAVVVALKSGPVQRRRLRKRLKVIMRRLEIYGQLSEVGLGVTGLKQPIGEEVSDKSSHNSQNAFVV